MSIELFYLLLQFGLISSTVFAIWSMWRFLKKL